MVINGYLIYNISKQNDDIFVTQINGFKKSFQNKKIKLNIVNNVRALSLITKDPKVDFVLFWDKDLALANILTNMNIKIFNNLDALTLCDDKAYTYGQFIKYKVLTPKTYIIPFVFYDDVAKYLETIKKESNKYKFQYPLIIKERCSSLGLGVKLAHNETEFKRILTKFGDRHLLLQEYIKEEVGIDYRVYLINHKVEAVVTRINKRDFRSNVEQGAKMYPVNNPSPLLLKEAIKASKATKLDFGAVDLVKQNNRYYALEVNSNARTLTIDQLTKINLTDKVVDYIISKI